MSYDYRDKEDYQQFKELLRLKYKYKTEQELDYIIHRVKKKNKRGPKLTPLVLIDDEYLLLHHIDDYYNYVNIYSIAYIISDNANDLSHNYIAPYTRYVGSLIVRYGYTQAAAKLGITRMGLYKYLQRIRKA